MGRTGGAGRLARLLLFLAAAEAVLARLSSDRQAPGDLLLSMGVLSALALGPWMAAALIGGRLPRLALLLRGAAGG